MKIIEYLIKQCAIHFLVSIHKCSCCYLSFVRLLQLKNILIYFWKSYTQIAHNFHTAYIIININSNNFIYRFIIFFNKHYSNTVLNRQTDFTALAKAFGADGEAVSTVEELEKALTRAFTQEGPYLIDCRIDKDEFVLPMLPPGGSMDDIIVKLEVEK